MVRHFSSARFPVSLDPSIAAFSPKLCANSQDIQGSFWGISQNVLERSQSIQRVSWRLQVPPTNVDKLLGFYAIDALDYPPGVGRSLWDAMHSKHYSLG